MTTLAISTDIVCYCIGVCRNMWNCHCTLLGRVLSLSWHPSGTQIAAGTMDMIRVFNVDSGETCAVLLQCYYSGVKCVHHNVFGRTCSPISRIDTFLVTV